MLTAAAALSIAFSPNAMPMQGSRTAVRTAAPLMVEEASSRRELLARAGAAVVGLSYVQGASAKAGQFSKQDIFSLVGEPAISSPYQPGGPKAGKGATFGYAKSEGAILADGYEQDVEREKKAFAVSKNIVNSQQANVDSKTWWLVRDNLRGQAYNMKANMKAINKALPADKQPAAQKAYDTFWKEINSLDLACVKKELDLAQKEYADVKEALKAYEAVAL